MSELLKSDGWENRYLTIKGLDARQRNLYGFKAVVKLVKFYFGLKILNILLFRF